jgi:hypothetical protein
MLLASAESARLGDAKVEVNTAAFPIDSKPFHYSATSPKKLTR